MKIAKKAIVILLALCTASSVMVGCAKKSSTTDTSASGGAKANLTVEVFDRGKPGQPPLNNNYWTKWINENFGKSIMPPSNLFLSREARKSTSSTFS
jgi:putative aldouronate transport system substrate-binding protein